MAPVISIDRRRERWHEPGSYRSNRRSTDAAAMPAIRPDTSAPRGIASTLHERRGAFEHDHDHERKPQPLRESARQPRYHVDDEKLEAREADEAESR